MHIVCYLSTLFLFAQKPTNTIAIKAKLHVEKRTIQVDETILFHNTTSQNLDRIYLTIWLNGHRSRYSNLTKAQLEKRKTKLYFQKSKDRGKIYDLEASEVFQFIDYDIIELFPKKPIAPKDSLEIKLNFTAKIPDYDITRYGNKGDYFHLKNWFFTVPAFEREKQTVYSNENFDDEFNDFANYSIDLQYPFYLEAISNLNIHQRHTFTGNRINNVEIVFKNEKIKDKTFYSQNFKKQNGESLIIESEFPINSENIQKQYTFLESYLGIFPKEKLLLTQRNQYKNKFVGIDDVKGWGIKLSLFPKEIQEELNLFNQLSNQFIEHTVLINKRDNHWILNGTKVYMQLLYLQTYHPDLKLLGDAPDNFKLLWTKPLKAFHLSKLNLQERYNLMNLFVIRKNVDQKITTPLDSLRNLNQSIISGVQTGMGFKYLDDYTQHHFNTGLKAFFTQYSNKQASAQDFKNTIEHYCSNHNIDWFFSEFLNTKKPYDFQLKKFKNTSDSTELIIKNKYNSKGPFKITAYQKDTILFEKWFPSKIGKRTYAIPNQNYTRIEINRNHIVPEINDLNNHINTKGLFKNKKTPQLKFLMDVQNPEYAQIFYQPILNWNNYDGFLLGMRLYNSTLINKRFHFAIAPQYSFETNALTGSAKGSYSIYPRTSSSIFERVRFEGGISYFHYDENLSYFQMSPSISFRFKRNYPRAEINNSLSFRINYLDKEVPTDISVNEDEYQYSIFNPLFSHSNNHKINELSYFVSLQQNKTFGKLFGSIYYRKRFAPRKIFGARLFGGYFYHNDTTSDYFDFGLDRVNDYMFDYQLYGRSETTGLLSQEYVLAEGGFKSDFREKANQWMLSTNLETDVWWRFSVYGDATYYKNRYDKIQFRYDSGVRLKLIPDFLEFYFPIQSSLGFEPSLDDKSYLERIRFVFKPNFGKAISYLRRGWY